LELNSGIILINKPKHNAGMFNSTVLFLFEHGPTGSAGVVLNRGTGQHLADVVRDLPGLQFPIGEAQIHAGGPVNPRGIMMLHTPEFASSNTLMINNTVSLSSDDFMIQKMCAGAVPDGYRLFAGHCGWGPGQLQKEIYNGVWLTSARVPATLLFDDNYKTIYNRALELASGELFDQYI